MIIVTGTGRCGSSLMMQSLSLLGVPIFGDPWKEEVNSYVDDVECAESRAIRENNPLGFYELPVCQMREFIRMDSALFYPGYAMKVLANNFLLLRKSHTEAVIYCDRRDKDAQAASMRKLGDWELAIQNKYGLDRLKDSLRYLENKTTEGIREDMRQTTRLIKKHINQTLMHNIVIYFEDLLEDPEKELNKVCRFLKINDEHLHDAVNNVIRR